MIIVHVYLLSSISKNIFHLWHVAIRILQTATASIAEIYVVSTYKPQVLFIVITEWTKQDRLQICALTLTLFLLSSESTSYL